MRRPLLLVAALCFLKTPGHAVGAEPAPSGVLALSASASVDVSHDLLRVVLATTRDGPEAAAVQSALKQALDTALTEARRAARPGQLDVQTGNFSLFPRQTPKGGVVGWQGTAELIVEGRDAAAIAQLTGRITTMTVARVGQSLSREQREQAEGEVAAQAIAGYRAKAEQYARQFGYASAAMREVNVSASDPPGFAPMSMRAAPMVASDESLPVMAGKATVTVVVSGTVQLTK